MRAIHIALLSIIITITGKGIYAQKEKEPDEQIIVNKKFDKDGNLIQFDSTYVHKWSSDSAFALPNGNFFSRKGIPNVEDFFNQFFNDSVTSGLGLSHHFNNQFFDNDFFKHFKPYSNDSSFNKGFGMNEPFSGYPIDSLHHFPPGFGFTNPEELRNLMDEQLNHFYGQNFEFHRFNNQQQSDEWQKLMQKHQKDIQEFRKKWDNKNSDR